MMFDMQYGMSLDDLVKHIDPLGQFQALKQLSQYDFLTSTNLKTNQDRRHHAANIAAMQIISDLDHQAHIQSPLWSFYGRRQREPMTDSELDHDNAIRKSSIYFNPEEQHDLPIVIDSGASISLTPNKLDFISKIKPTKLKSLNGLSHKINVVGMGTVEWTVRDVLGQVRRIRTLAYYVPEATIRLFSPQSYFQEHYNNKACQLYMDSVRTVLTLSDGSILEFPYQQTNNLPMMLTDSIPVIGCTIADTELFNPSGFVSVADEINQNLTASQRELLLWHQRLGHANMRWIQALFAAPKSLQQPKASPLLQCRETKVSSCPPPMCTACMLSKQTRRTPPQGGARPNRPSTVLRSGHLQPGDKVSCDQYVSALPGRLPTGFGRAPPTSMYHGGTIFVDHATQFIFIRNQVSLQAAETLRAKRAFDQLAATHGWKIKSYRADNMPFNSEIFRHDLALKGQTIDFSGVGAHHQNGVAERAIQTVTQWARAMLLHSILHWPDAADLTLWPFAFEHAVYLWNHIPRQDSRLSPAELFSGAKDSHTRLQRSHVWGCPVFVLDPKLQDGQSIPKWNPRARRGMFLGQSPSHSSTIGRILNLQTQYISPQYHVVYDDKFTTVPHVEGGGLLDLDNFTAETWRRLVETGLERHMEPTDSEASPDPPALHNDWLTLLERRLRDHRRHLRELRQQHATQRRALRRQQHPGPLQPPPVFQPQHDPQGPEGGEAQQDDNPNQEQENNPIQGNDDQNQSVDDEPFPNVDNDDLSLEERNNGDNDELPQQEQPVLEEQQIPRNTTRVGRQVKPNRRFIGREWAKYSATHKVKVGTWNNQKLAMLNWAKLRETLTSGQLGQIWAQIEEHTDPDDDTVEWMHPTVLAAKAQSEDNPTWEEAMNGPLSQGYWEAAKKEISTLEEKGAWEVVERQSHMNVLPSTWAFKCKRYPNGEVRKLKGRFCVRGDRQIENVDYFETFAPVVNWNTVRLLLILSLVLGLSTKQVDYTAAFVHAPINEDVYVEMPRGFQQKGHVLKLKRSLYGLKQSPRNFFLHLKEKLEACGFRNQENTDPCLFISDDCICLVYVDDTLFFAPKQEYIEKAITKLREQEMELEIEESVAGFLGVHIERNDTDSTIKLTQAGLTQRIIDALGINENGLPPKQTPAAAEPLVKDEAGDPPDGHYNYASVIGMLQYLQAHSRPDITYAVSSAARFIHCPRRSHEKGLERIGQYLKGTINEGLILNPTGRFDIDCYVDADFAGLWPHEDKLDPTCVKSRTGYVICISGCPVIWISKLQDLICLSTMEAEYNALSASMRDVLPIQELLKTIGQAIGLSEETLTTFKTTVHEDNTGAWTLARLEPGRITPRSKHYAIKLHWFRSHLKPNRVEVSKISTDQQKADILTKGLRTEPFQKIRKLLCGW